MLIPLCERSTDWNLVSDGTHPQEMSREMMKAGVIEEMMEDTFEAIDDPEELEEDVQQAVDKILSGNSIHKFSSGVL